MIYYSKITTKNKKTFAEDVFIKNKISLKCVVFDENNVTKSKDSIFNKVKNKALKEKEITIDTIKSIGKDNREIAKELKWMLDNKIKLIVLDISQTKVKGVNSTLFLYEVYRQLAEIEKNNVKTAQKEGISNAIKEKRPYGRPRAEYPKNWEILYKKWKSKKISSQEFIDASGLKKPTFYNMLKNYMVSIGDLKGNDTIRLRKTGT